jgi:hypothetical protein
MEEFEYLQVFGFGVLGGTLVELLRWWKLRTAPEFPYCAGKPGYWVLTILMILAGGILACLYGLDASNAAALVNIGASTPAILGALACSAQPRAELEVEPSGLGEKSFSGSGPRSLPQSELMRRFFAFGR